MVIIATNGFLGKAPRVRHFSPKFPLSVILWIQSCRIDTLKIGRHIEQTVGTRRKSKYGYIHTFQSGRKSIHRGVKGTFIGNDRKNLL